ncbi:MAG: hypothetical protein ACYTA5_25260 [Planctomycetota bacterium]
MQRQYAQPAGRPLKKPVVRYHDFVDNQVRLSAIDGFALAYNREKPRKQDRRNGGALYNDETRNGGGAGQGYLGNVD